MCVQVLQALKVKYRDVYRQDNVLLSGTHTHSGPAGYFQYTLFMITSKGYIPAAMKPLVNGIVKVSVTYPLVIDHCCICRGKTSFSQCYMEIFTASFGRYLPSGDAEGRFSRKPLK